MPLINSMAANEQKSTHRLQSRQRSISKYGDSPGSGCTMARVLQELIAVQAGQA